MTPDAWSVGVITAPRSRPTISYTLDQLTAAGWPAPRIFFEHGCDWPPACYRSFWHAPPAGCYRNFRHALATLLVFDPAARHYLIVEDDCQFSVGLRQHLESSPPPAGLVSLYCAAPNHRDRSGWNEVQVPLRAYGALAYWFTPELAWRFVADPPHPEWANMTDHAVGLWCRRERIPYWCHSPSFVRHTGDHTTLPAAGLPQNRQCREFLVDARPTQEHHDVACFI